MNQIQSIVKYLIFLLIIVGLSGCNIKSEKTEQLQTAKLIYSSTITNEQNIEYTEDLKEMSEKTVFKNIVAVKVLKSYNGETTASMNDNKLYIKYSKGKMKNDTPGYEYGVELEVSYYGESVDKDYIFKDHDILLVDLYNGKIYEGQMKENEFPDKDIEEKVSGVIAHLAEFQKQAYENPKTVEAIKKAVLDGLDSPKDIALASHRYIQQNFKYNGNYRDFLKLNSISDKYGFKSMMDMFEDKSGVCYQLAYFYKAIMDAYHIENTLVYGNLSNADDVGEVSHVWNSVKINDTWFYVDNTGGDESFSEVLTNHHIIYKSNI